MPEAASCVNKVSEVSLQRPLLDVEPKLLSVIQTVQGALWFEMIVSKQNYMILSLKLLG